MKFRFMIAFTLLFIFSAKESAAMEERSFLREIYGQTYLMLSSFFFNQQDEEVKDDHWKKLTPEIQLNIFQFLNKRDVFPVITTKKQFSEVMDDNHLWKVYAEKALVITGGKYCEEIDYKALVKYHCTPSFMDLGTLNGGQSWPQDMSFDGSIIVGYALIQGLETAFVYTLRNGMQSLDSLNEGKPSYATAINSDGQHIVGYGKDSAGQIRAILWSLEDGNYGAQSLEALNGGTSSQAMDISGDGKVIVGYGNNGAQVEALVWTFENGKYVVQSLGMNGGEQSRAKKISSNGSVIAIEVTNGVKKVEACQWTFEEGFNSLGVPKDGYVKNVIKMDNNGGAGISFEIDKTANADDYARTFIEGMSDNGSVITGYYLDPQMMRHPFVWTSEKDMQNLKPIGPSYVHGVNIDGSRMVGQMRLPSLSLFPERACLWAGDKIELIEGLLNTNNSLPPGWVLTQATSITPSGVVLTGIGHYSDQIDDENKEFSSSILRTKEDFITHARREERRKATQRIWRVVIPKSNLF